ncbi:hypothetical protein Tco_1427328 [Tanacetum coccineum]
MRRVKASTFWRRHGRDKVFRSSSFHDYVLGFPVSPFHSASSVFRVSFEDNLTLLLRRLRRLSHESELEDVSPTRWSAFASLACDNATVAQPIKAADLPVHCIHECPILQVSCLSTQTLLFRFYQITGGRRLSFKALSLSGARPKVSSIWILINSAPPISVRDPFSCEVVSPNTGPLFRDGWGWRLGVFVPLAAVLSSGVNSTCKIFWSLDSVRLAGCPQDGPVAGKDQDQMAYWCFHRPLLETCLSLVTLPPASCHCGDGWVVFPCFGHSSFAVFY